MQIRKNTWDSNILAEVNNAYGWMNVKNKVVLDIGACFGAATQMFLDNGARQVIAVEPEPDNLRLLRKNVGGDSRVTIMPRAITGDGEPTRLYLSPGVNTGAHSLHVTRGRESIPVPGIGLPVLLRQYRPACIKVDCEGAEYDFIHDLPGHVKQIAMEIHLNKKAWRERAPDFISQFDAWRCVRQPVITERNWHTLGGWVR